MRTVPLRLRPTPGDQLLTHEEALQSPCDSCGPAPCCTTLQVEEFTMAHLEDLDYAKFLLGFEGIELVLLANGRWRVHFHAACRLLDATHRCTVHGTDAQPHICRDYDAYACSYRPLWVEGDETGAFRIDERRLAVLSAEIGFDRRRRIATLPPWEWMAETFAALGPAGVTSPERGSSAMPPVGERSAPAGGYGEATDAPTPGGAPAPTSRPRRAAAGSPGADGARPGVPAVERPGARRLSFLDPAVQDPCASCAAWCCTRLVFPIPAPERLAQLDFVRFSLGFPGVEVAIDEHGWALVLATRCRHLRGTRCSLYGTPDRPLHCSSFSALGCRYPESFGDGGPRDGVRLGFDQLEALLELATVEGGSVRPPTVAALRRAGVGVGAGVGSQPACPAAAPS